MSWSRFGMFLRTGLYYLLRRLIYKGYKKLVKRLHRKHRHK